MTVFQHVSRTPDAEVAALRRRGLAAPWTSAVTDAVQATPTETLPSATVAGRPTGHALEGVRIHTGEASDRATDALGARAFTLGRSVVLGRDVGAVGSSGRRAALEHELVHVAQQAAAGPIADRPLLGHASDGFERSARAGTSHRLGGAVPLVQRDERIGPAASPPADWTTRVANARTSAQRAALIASATGLAVLDRTAESASDRSPAAAHLVELTPGSRQLNYDDGLNGKVSPVDGRRLTSNVAYTLSSGNRSFVIIGPTALDGTDFYATRISVNHEFDHVRQSRTGSSLAYGASELDAWTSSFVREFHRQYTILVRGSACYIDHTALFAPLGSYFSRDDVSERDRQRAVERIAQYYRDTIANHAIHRAVFRRWILLSLRGSSADLANRVNTALSLGVTADERGPQTRAVDCSQARAATFPPPPEVGDPFASSPGGAATGATGERRLGLEIRGGVSQPTGAARIALGLGTRYSLRSDQLIILNPTIGAQLVFLPSTGPTSEHVAVAIAELGLRIQQPLTGVYGDLRAGGFVGIGLPGAAGTGAGPRAVGGFAGAAGVGYRWERIELGVEGRALLGPSDSQFIVLGSGALRF